MKPNELLNQLEEIAPLSISEEFCKKFNAYDNSGLLVDCGEDINGVLFSLDLSQNAVNEAKRLGFNLIITHHPAIYGKLGALSVADPYSGLIVECIRWGISVISMHLNLDAAPNGIDYGLMIGLGGEAGKPHIKLTSGAYGRVYDIKAKKLGEYVKFISERFATKRIVYYGDDQKPIKRVVSFCGAGCDDDSIAFAVEEEADAFVSSDFKHHQITALLARGIAVIILPHYTAECYGFNYIYNKITEGLSVPTAFYRDENLI